MMGKVIMSGIVPNLSEPVTLDPVFANNDWATIIEACQKNKVPDTWVVGDQKTMTINGTDYVIDIIGKNHDVYSDGSGTAPLTFQLHDCYLTKYPMNSSDNVVPWESCTMKTTHLPSILSLMPTEVQSGIREVNKKTANGNSSSTISTSANKLFLLSEVEVRGSSKWISFDGEGKQYAYYASGNSFAKYRHGSTSSFVKHWLRSPSKSIYYYYVHVTNSSTTDDYKPTSSYDIAPAFCF